MRTWTVNDVMTAAVVSVEPAASYRSLVDLLIGHRFSAVPVVDEDRRVVGVVSEADLLAKIEYAEHPEPRLFDRLRRNGHRAKASAGTAAELMSAPAVVVPTGTTIAAAARLMDAEQVKRLPVVDGAGRLAGIVSRGDLLKVHLRSDDEIRDEIKDGVVGVYLAEEYEAVSVEVHGGVVMLSGRLDRRSAAELGVRLTRQVAGVVDVVDALEFGFDDVRNRERGTMFGAS
jgi:CBS-domain-containing membrane protein